MTCRDNNISVCCRICTISNCSSPQWEYDEYNTDTNKRMEKNYIMYYVDYILSIVITFPITLIANYHNGLYNTL